MLNYLISYFEKILLCPHYLYLRRCEIQFFNAFAMAAVFRSLSEEDRDDDFTEGVNCRAHRRNKNGHHCRFGNEMVSYGC